MNKFFLCCLILFITQSVNAKVEFIWSGIAGVYLTDGKNSVYIDPVFSRPNIPQILLGMDYDIDEKKVISELDRLGINKIDGIFIGHSHCDHALDMHVVQKHAGGIIHGTETTINLAMAYNIPDANLKIMEDAKEYKFGDFTVIPLKSQHGLILDLFEFQGGVIDKPLKRKPKLSDYQMGGSFGFYVSHPEGNYLVQQSSRTTENIANFLKDKKMKIIFQGIANRRNSQELYEGIINHAESVEYIVPIHHDNFFFQRSEKKVDLLWGLDLEEFLEYSKTQKPKVFMPEYDTRYAL